MTQASVERTFSDLRFILNERRLGLKADIIDAIMMLRCNTQLCSHIGFLYLFIGYRIFHIASVSCQVPCMAVCPMSTK